MSLANLLPPSEFGRFLADSFQKLPYARVSGAAAITRLASREMFDHVCLAPDADVLIVRRNRRSEEPLPVSPADIERILATGSTILIRQAQRHHAELASFAAELAHDFAAPVNLHLYCTPQAEQGFGWHYDAEEVFLIQGEGRKEYSLRKNSVNPWPIQETLPADMRYERELMPLLRCLLAPGDWLYIPSGYWHCGAAQEFSITLAAGVQPRTAVDLYDQIRPAILDSLLWRQRLPVLGRANDQTDSELETALAALAADLSADVSRLLRNPQFLRQVLHALRSVVA